MKNCSKCQVNKNDSEFYKNKEKLSSWCRSCTRAKVNGYRKQNSDLVKERKKKYYNENKERILEKNRLYKEKNPADYAEEYRKYRNKVGDQQYKEECRERAVKYRNNNREIVNENARKWRENNKEKAILRTREYREQKGEEHLERRREIYYEDIERHRQYKRKRDKLKKIQTPVWADKKKIKEIYDQCYSLNKEKGRKKYAVDHIYPLNSDIMCGLHWHENLRIICYKKNSVKGNRIEETDL